MTEDRPPRPATSRPPTAAWWHRLWVAGLVAVVWLACFRFPVVWAVTGIGEADRPFMDLYGILAASDAAQAGVDPFRPNDFDPYHRPHVYTEWWLEIGRLGWHRADTLWLGAILLAVVLATAVGVAGPRTRREGLGLFFLLVSPALLMAVNRANNDLVVFVVVSLGLLCFRTGRRAAQAAGVLLLAVATVLKYYPLAAFVVLLDLRSRRGLVASLGLCALVLVLAWPGLEPGLRSAAKFMPQPDWLYAFGAPVFLRDLDVNTTLGWLLPALLLGIWAVANAFRAMTGTRGEAPSGEVWAEREFMCGAAMLTGLFFLGTSYVYKLIFAVWLLPWLWRGPHDAAEARWCRITGGLLMAVVWWEGALAVGLNLLTGALSTPVALVLLKGTLIIGQLLTWALVACLLRLSLPQAGRRLRALFSPAAPEPS